MSSDQILQLVAASVIGSVATLIVQWIIKKNTDRKLKKVVNAYLINSILPICDILKDEIKLAEKTIEEPGFQISLDTHPQLSTLVLESFGLEKILPLYGKNAPHVVDIIGIIEHLGKTRPRDVVNNYIDILEEHMTEYYSEEQNGYENSDEHYRNCPVLVNARDFAHNDFNNLRHTVSNLEHHITKVTGYLKNQMS